MHILLASLELFPFVKVGGIADAVSALAHALAENGHRVTVAVPRRDGVSLPGELAPRVAIEALEVSGYASGDLYGHDVVETVEEAARHAALTDAVLALIAAREASGDGFDVVHVHDWPLAMVPYLMRERRVSPETRSVLTIHNVAFQGILLPEALGTFGLGPEHLTGDRLLFHGRASMLKGGLVAADALTTVSPSYGRAILSPEHGHGLDGVLRERREPVFAILNGIDTDVWDPSRDAAIAAPFDAGERSGKAACKASLLGELGLDADLSRPLFAHVGRLFFEKGADVLVEALPEIVRRGATIVVVGTGDASTVDAMRKAASGLAPHAAALGWVSEPLAHRVFAGADALLVPSRIEPCGLVQMYAQRYGALPIANRTGGLADTIVDESEREGAGTGLLYDGPGAAALLDAVDRALALYRGHGFDAVASRAMRLSRSWARPAAEYERAYATALRAPRR